MWSIPQNSPSSFGNGETCKFAYVYVLYPALCLGTAGTFFHSVWSTLASTGVGERLSYSELAKLAGSPKAARAVGQAMKRHSLPILVPCHRVVKSKGGGIGNYSGGEGSATKEWLLEHEREMALCNNTVQ